LARLFFFIARPDPDYSTVAALALLEEFRPDLIDPEEQLERFPLDPYHPKLMPLCRWICRTYLSLSTVADLGRAMTVSVT
jgi:hypothetical protein